LPTKVPCERVDLSFLETAPHRFCISVELTVTAAQPFEVLADADADADAWPRWATVITKVTWTSPQPRRSIGTTRIVDMRGGIVGSKLFPVCEPDRRMAFRFNECSTGTVAALAEDYRIEPTARGCRLTWTLANRLVGPARLSVSVASPIRT